MSIIFVFLFLSIPDVSATAQNLLKNPDFEEAQDARPLYWEYDTWIKDRKTAKIGLTFMDPHSGRSAVEMDVTEPDDVKLLQKIGVSPDSLYRFSCWVKAWGIASHAKGANLSVLGILDTSENVYDTAGQWRQISLYGKTGADQQEVVFTLRLGGYGSLNKGRAAFDGCIVEKLDSLPHGLKVVNLNPLKDKGSLGSSASYFGWIVFGTILIVVLSFLAFRYRGYDFKETFGFNEQRSVYLLFASGFLIKLLLALLFTGYPVDIMTFKAWADIIAKKGFSEFYYSGHFVDYPPLYMYVYYTVGKLRLWFNIGYDSQLFILLLKIPSLVAEFVSAIMIYRIARSSAVPSMALITAIVIYIFNPVLTINSSLWGQSDSVLTLLVAVALISIFRGRPIMAAVIFTCAVLMKPQALMFTPLFIFYFYRLKDWVVLLKALAASIAVAFVIIMPFSVSHGPLWIIKIFKNAFVQYPYATLNAFNIYALIGKNWAPVNSVFILPLKVWGTLAIFAITVISGLFYIRSTNPHKVFIVAIFISVSVFMFSTEMHERYMVPAFMLFCIVYTMTGDKRLLFIISGFILTNAINLGYTLALAHQGIYHLRADDLVLRVCSFANVVLYVLTVRWAISCLFAPFKKRAMSASDVEDNGSFNKDHTGYDRVALPFAGINLSPDITVSKRDWCWALLIALCYSILVFYNLGSVKSPQTYWKPGIKGEAFYIDFGGTQDIARIVSFSGIGKGRHRVEVSNDFINWTTATVINQKAPFQWTTLKTNSSNRYLSIVTEEPGAALYEIGLFDRQGRLIAVTNPVPFAVAAQTEGKVRNLFDEQGTVPETSSYMNSMYFDEIYFARTAYEILHNMEPYENTHPPLGKLFIASGVRAFGMTPFGWRFAGALAGVFLVVMMFFMGRLIFGSTEYGILSAALMSLDFMTLVQSRLATVDIFAVLFVVTMYYFMFRFYLMPHCHQRVAFLNLGLSGLFFGLGVSTKWLCLYGGFGLAAIYFYKFYKDWRGCGLQKPSPTSSRHKKGQKTRSTQSKAPVSILFRYLSYGLIFFVTVPVIIYFMSYIPFMMLPGPGHDLMSVLEYQVHMFQYHKSVKGSHPFASSWWQWPLLVKPMWLYMGTELPADRAASIVTMGNPLIWWGGLLSLFYMLYVGIFKKGLHAVGWLIILGIASNYGPWVFVPREVYIYHFFATVPFIVLGLVYCLRLFSAENRPLRYLAHGYALASLLLFLLFYPILTGLEVDKAYMMRYLKWFDSWIFFVS